MGAAGQHDAAELLRHADVAMYAAKEAGKGRSAVFAPDMDSAIIGQLRLKAELARAVERGEFTVHYQPTVELANGRLAGVEALVRWQHPERGLVPPLDFIPLAEQTGLIVPDRPVRAARGLPADAGRGTRSYPTDPPMTVSVNLSARELDEPGLVGSVRARPGGDAAWTRPTWSWRSPRACCWSTCPATIGTLLRAAGAGRPAGRRRLRHRLLLAGLPREPAGGHPQDRQVLRRPHRRDAGRPAPATRRSPQQPVMVSAISQLGHALHLQLVAEGIEQPEQVSTLRGLACQYGQGYYFARPLTPDALDALLDRQADGAGLEPDAAASRAPVLAT